MIKLKKRSYELAEKIQSLQPWNYFQDSDPIYVEYPDGSFVFLDVMGAAGHIFGLTMFEGEIGLDTMLRMFCGSENFDENENIYFMCDMSNITLYFDAEKDLSNPSFSNCIEKEYRNKSSKVPYFMEYERGYFPTIPQNKSFKRIEDYLFVFTYILEKIQKEGLDQQEDDLLAVYLDEDYKTGDLDSFTFTTLPRPEQSTRYLGITCDKNKFQKLKKKKRTDSVWTLDAAYFDPAFDGEVDRVIYPYGILLAGEEFQRPILQIITPREDRINFIQNLIYDAINEFGIPDGIAVRKEEMFASIEPIAEELKFKIYDAEDQKEDLDDFFNFLKTMSSNPEPQS